VTALQELAQLRVYLRWHLDQQWRVWITRAQFAQDLSGCLLLVAQGADDLGNKVKITLEISAVKSEAA
jgi:hypothetical protein